MHQFSRTERSPELTALARAVLDSFTEGLLLFDANGRLAYANRPGREALRRSGGSESQPAEQVLDRLAPLRPRLERLTGLADGGLQAVFLVPGGAVTLAERERRAILETVEATGWRLAAAARQLGISRTTLWRRLRQYGLQRRGPLAEPEDSPP